MAKSNKITSIKVKKHFIGITIFNIMLIVKKDDVFQTNVYDN